MHGLEKYKNLVIFAIFARHFMGFSSVNDALLRQWRLYNGESPKCFGTNRILIPGNQTTENVS